MEHTPSTADQHQAIKKAAAQRRDFLLWIADKLEETTDIVIRKEAARALRELVA